jgi:YgiT-type zinc finger domain-containing protein
MSQTHLCPICGASTVVKQIDYIDWSNGHILVIREVPVRECRDFGHQFMAASVAKKIESLFNLDRLGTLHPQEVLTAPVVKLDALEHLLPL